MKFFFAVLAFAAGASAINVGLGWSGADVAIARAAHLAEVSRITGERLGALNAALARNAGLGQVVVGGGLRGVVGGLGWSGLPIAPQDNPDVAIAKAAHLAEHARQTGAALSALAAAPRWGGPIVAAPLGLVAGGLGWSGLPIAPQDTPSVAIAKAAHLAEVARQNGAALTALAAANARNGLGWSA